MRARPGPGRPGMLLLALAPLLLAGCTDLELPEALGGGKGGGTFAVEVVNDSQAEVQVLVTVTDNDGADQVARKEFSLLPGTSARHSLQAPSTQFTLEADVTATRGEGHTRVADTRVHINTCDGLLLYRIQLGGDRDALSARSSEVRCET